MTSSGRKHLCSQRSVFLLSRWRRTFSPSCFVFLCEWAELQGGRCLAGGARSRPEEGAGHLAEAPPRPRQPLPATAPPHPGGVRGNHRAALQRPQSAVGGSEFRTTPPPTTTTRGHSDPAGVLQMVRVKMLLGDARLSRRTQNHHLHPDPW